MFLTHGQLVWGLTPRLAFLSHLPSRSGREDVGQLHRPSHGGALQEERRGHTAARELESSRAREGQRAVGQGCRITRGSPPTSVILLGIPLMKKIGLCG